MQVQPSFHATLNRPATSCWKYWSYVFWMSWAIGRAEVSELDTYYQETPPFHLVSIASEAYLTVLEHFFFFSTYCHCHLCISFTFLKNNIFFQIIAAPDHIPRIVQSNHKGWVPIWKLSFAEDRIVEDSKSRLAVEWKSAKMANMRFALGLGRELPWILQTWRTYLLNPECRVNTVPWLSPCADDSNRHCHNTTL